MEGLKTWEVVSRLPTTHPEGSRWIRRPPRWGTGLTTVQPVGRTKSTEAATASKASSSALRATRVFRDFSRA